MLQLLTPFHVLSAVRVDNREGIAAGDAVDFSAIIRFILVPDSVQGFSTGWAVHVENCMGVVRAGGTGINGVVLEGWHEG